MTVVVELGAVYSVSGVPADAGIAPLVFTLNVFAIVLLLYHESAMLRAVASSVVATVPASAGRVRVMFPLNAL